MRGYWFSMSRRRFWILPGRRALADLLASLPQANILVTNDTDFARSLTEDAVFFEKGKIAARGPIDEIVERFGW